MERNFAAVTVLGISCAKLTETIPRTEGPDCTSFVGPRGYNARLTTTYCARLFWQDRHRSCSAEHITDVHLAFDGYMQV